MRTLLTGAKGQLARCLRDRLPEDWELIATDSTSLDIYRYRSRASHDQKLPTRCHR